MPSPIVIDPSEFIPDPPPAVAKPKSYKIDAKDFTPTDETGAALSKVPAQMSQAPGLGARIVDEAERIGSYYGGATIGSPAGPVGAGVAGGVAATAADVDIARRHAAKYGTPIDLSPGNLAKDAAWNVGGGVTGEKFLGPLIEKIAGGALGLVTAKPELQAGALETLERAGKSQEEATAAQAAKNLAERTDTYQAAVARQATEHAQAQKLAAKQAEANTAEQQTAAEKGMSAQQTFADKQAKIAQETAEQKKAIQDKALKQVQPQARVAQFEAATGRGGEGAVAARTESQAARIARKQSLYQTISEPLNAFSKNWAARRDALLKDSMGETVDASPLQGSLQRQEAYLAARPGQTFSRPVTKLLDTASGISGGGGGLPPEITSFGKTEKLTDVLKGKSNLSLDDYRNFAEKLGMTNVGGGATVERLLAARSQASAIAAASSGADRTAAADVVSAIDDSLAKDPVLNQKLPSLAKLNQEWRDHKELFPDSLRDSITAGTPAQFGPQLFDEPVRAQEWLRLAKTPDQKLAFRNLYTDYVQDGLAQGKRIDQMVKPVHADFLNQVFPHTPLATREGIEALTTRAMSLEDTLASSPAVRQQFMQQVVPAIRQQTIKGMQDVTREAVTQARKMGPLGQQIVKRIEAANGDPVEQYKIATEAMTGATPDKLSGAVATGQQAPQMVAPQSPSPMQAMQGLVQKSPETAGREAIMGMGLPNQTRGGLPIPQPTTPEEAAIAAIRASSTGGGRGANYFIQRATHLWPLYAAIGGPALASGHLNFPGMMLLVGGANVLAEPIKRAFAKSLEDPVAAAAFFRGIMNPAAPGAMQAITNSVASDVVGSTGKAISGTTLEKAPDNKPTPMTREYDRTTAVKVVGPKGDPSRTEHIESLNRDLRKGKTPDVASGLRTGRLSMPAVKRLLKMQSTKTAPAMLAHLGPDDIKHLLELASPEERAWLEPLAQQRLGTANG